MSFRGKTHGGDRSRRAAGHAGDEPKSGIEDGLTICHDRDSGREVGCVTVREQKMGYAQGCKSTDEGEVGYDPITHSRCRRYGEMFEKMVQKFKKKMVRDQTGAGSKPWKRIAEGGSISRGGVRGSREEYSNEGNGIDAYEGDEEGVGGNGTERDEVFL